MQVGFYNFIVLPAYETLHGVFGDPVIDLVGSINKNLAKWKELENSGTKYSLGADL